MDGPKKSLGQHWLHDEGVLNRIVAAGNVQANDVVLEIGPGLGTLTAKLLATGAKVTAIEFDDVLLPALKGRFVDNESFRLVQGDILKYDFSQLPPDYKIVANIPYYLTSHLLRLLTDSPTPPETAVLLVQKEVAQRVCAAAGDMSILSVAVQIEYDASLGELVPAVLFTPPPKVDSQVLILKKRASPLFKDLDKDRFIQVMKAGFSAKRKTLRNTISAGLHLTKEEAETALDKAGIDFGRRAETLTLEEWQQLSVILTR